MIDDPQFRPDITLTIDGGGVIRNAVSAEALAGEPIGAVAGPAVD